VVTRVLINFPVGAAPGSKAPQAGMLGERLRPVLSPIGIDPNPSIALMFGFFAKEVVIVALEAIYGQ
jgi:ferrous iron transport protein B